MYPAHNGFRHPDQVQRKINDGIRFRNNLPRHIIAAYGKRRYQDLALRHDFLDFFDQRAGSYDLTDRRAVDPDAV